jgi:hypothetical protein
LSERGIGSLLRSLLAAADDELFGALVVASLETLGLLTPRRARVATTRAAAFAATHRVIDGVHRHATVVRASALPTHAAGLAPHDVRVLGVADHADRGAAVDVDAAHLARGQTQRGPVGLLRHQRDARAGRAAELCAATDLELDAVDLGADRDVAQRQRVARLDIRRVRRHDGVADAQLLRREDVRLLAVLVLDQRDARRAVRVVLDPEHGRLDAGLLALEVDRPIALLVTAAAEARRDAAVVVATSGLDVVREQRLLGLVLGDLAEVLRRRLTATGRGGLVLLGRHGPRPPRRTRCCRRP